MDVTASDAAAPVAVTISVNGEAETYTLPATIGLAIGDIVTAEAKALNDVDYRVTGWTGGASVLSDGSVMEFTVAGEEVLTVNIDRFGPDNLALGKAVTASQAHETLTGANLTNGTLCYLTDGWWSSSGLGSGTTFAEHSVVIDLGAETAFNRLHLYPRRDNADKPVECFPTAYTVYTSNNNADWTPVYSVTDGAVPESLAPSVITLDSAVTARYVKLGVTGINRGDSFNNAYVQLYELGIYMDDQDEKAAAAVDALIEAIGTVSLDSKAAIDTARTAYEELNDNARDKVTRLAVLEAAEAVYKVISSEVKLTVTGPKTVNVRDNNVMFTVSAEGMMDVTTITVAMELDETCLTGAEAAVVAEGWYLLAQTYKNGKLMVSLANNDGANGSADLFTVTAVLTGTAGKTAVTVTTAQISAYVGGEECFVQTDLTAASCEVEVTFNPFDLNRDGVVDLLDVTHAQRYFGMKGTIADVDGSGEVDIADLVLILNQFI